MNRWLSTLLIVAAVNSAAAETYTMRYGPAGTVERYAFSQRGWQDMSAVSEGNVIAGYIRHDVQNSADGAWRHALSLSEVAVTYLVPKAMHIKQPSDLIVGPEIPVVTKPGAANHIDLTREQRADVPFLAGITPSSLLVDLPMLLLPLPEGPVAPGDRWAVSIEESFPTRLPAGHRHNPGTEDQWREQDVTSTTTYEYVGMTERLAHFGARDKIPAMHIRGIGTLESLGLRPGGKASMDESIAIEAYFDPAAGRWLEVVHEATSTMQIRMGEREMSGKMGFTNQYRFVREE